MIKTQDLKILTETFSHINTQKKVFIAKLNGKPIKVISGKWNWSSIGGVKNAINNHFRNSLHWHLNTGTPGGNYNPGLPQLSSAFKQDFNTGHYHGWPNCIDSKELRKHLEKEGILKYEELVI